MGKLVSDAKCGIERNNFLVVIKIKVLLGKFDSISGA